MDNQKKTYTKKWINLVVLHCILYTALLIPVRLILFPREPYSQLFQHYTATYIVGYFLIYGFNNRFTSKWLFRLQLIIFLVYCVLTVLLINFSFQKPLLTLPVILSFLILELVFFKNRNQFKIHSTVIHVISALHDCIYCYILISITSNFDKSSFPIKWLFAITALINCIILLILDQNDPDSSKNINEKSNKNNQHVCTIETNY